ncbi:MAG: hypothetical protein U0636_08635 [Phycisphaerales bacterium]
MNGIFAVDKPLGISSMRAVSVVRRCAGGARTGHAGTLDPLATGVLVMAIGPSTRRIESLMATDKRYETRIDLSAFTTTDDTEGERTEVSVDRFGAPCRHHHPPRFCASSSLAPSCSARPPSAL